MTIYIDTKVSFKKIGKSYKDALYEMRNVKKRLSLFEDEKLKMKKVLKEKEEEVERLRGKVAFF